VFGLPPTIHPFAPTADDRPMSARKALRRR